MTNATISIPVDEATAIAYSQASVEEQKNIQLFLRLRVRELFTKSDVSLQQIMDDISIMKPYSLDLRQKVDACRGFCLVGL